ncbi:MlaD family protein [Gordonia humi]|uniref:Virulence factor Mce-like protein n=1 Tax=Gordonia humi TaxID=686429 RepID=A0A840F7W4_9ACTN|nr:MlaD family protein [Gordonia humi]MBB4137669.1 virulence factor Mce-like protein [Gordonia humi]
MTIDLQRVRTAAIRAVVLAVVATLGLTGCSAYAKFAPENLPTPQSMSDGYEIAALVPTAVNLPLESNVVVGGITAGGVAAIEPADGATRITLRIHDGVVVSASARLELRQDTLLGDTYVSITNPRDPSGDALRPGGTLALKQVAQPVQIEQLMSSLTNFLGSGSLLQLGNTFNALTGQFPEDPKEIVKIESVLTDTLDTWATSTDDLGGILTDLAALSTRLTSMRDTLEFTLSPAGVNQFKAISDTTYMVAILGRLSDALGPAMPLVPVLTSLTRTVQDVLTPLMIPGYPGNTISNAEMLSDVLTDKVIPWLNNAPGVDLRSVTVANNVSDRDVTAQMVRMFRMLGLVE